MTKCEREGCNNEIDNEHRFCSNNCGAIVMGEAMQKWAESLGGSYFILRPEKPEGEGGNQ